MPYSCIKTFNNNNNNNNNNKKSCFYLFKDKWGSLLDFDIEYYKCVSGYEA